MIYKCKECGGELVLIVGEGICECDSCGKKVTVSRLGDPGEQRLLDRADAYRRQGRFDEAGMIYDKLLTDHPKEPELYWLLVLCRYGIEYVEEAGRFLPTIHRMQTSPIFSDADYKEALKYADNTQRSIYEESASEIDRIYREFSDIMNNEQSFDVFISYKESGDDGKRTKDSELARDLYDHLVDEGLKVFYAPVTLEKKLGERFEPYIFAALQSARVMVLIGTKKEHLEAVWVRNEWNRFLQLTKEDKSRRLIPAYMDMDPADLPKELSGIQAKDMKSIGWKEDLWEMIRPLCARRGTDADADKEKLLKRMSSALEQRDWAEAERCAGTILDSDPDNAEALLGRLQSERKASRREALAESERPLDESPVYKKLLEAADENLRSRLLLWNDAVKDGIAKARNEQIYQEALAILNGSSDAKELEQARQRFITIREWKDSEQKIAECIKKTAELEQAKRSGEKQARKKERDRKLKKTIRDLVIVAVIIIAIPAALFIYRGISASMKEAAYKKGQEALAAGDYVKAYSLFREAGREDAIKDSMKQRGQELLESGDTEAGLALLQQAGDTESVLRAQYEQAEEALAEKDYDRAYELFGALGDYNGADEMLIQIRLSRADAAAEEGDVIGALSQYRALADLGNEEGSGKYRELKQTVFEGIDRLLTEEIPENDEEPAWKWIRQLEGPDINTDERLKIYRVLQKYGMPEAGKMLAEDPWLEGVNDENSITGRIGIGTWHTRMDVPLINVTANENGEELYHNDFSEKVQINRDPFLEEYYGEWVVLSSGLRQQSGSEWKEDKEFMVFIGEAQCDWKDITAELKVTVLGESEKVFMLAFDIPDMEDDEFATFTEVNEFYYVELGNGSNGTALVHMKDGARTVLASGQTVAFEMGESYALSLVLQGRHVAAYVDGTLVLSAVI